MRRLFLLLLLFPVSTGARERLPEGYFLPPLEGVLLPSANFAETRPGHLHSGVDIKTGGVEGKPLHAAADGYISRIGIAPRGFGNTIYITHPNGTMTVYAHMQRFTPEVADHVRAERYRQRKNAIDVYPAADAFPVRQGELIGWSGNTGSSEGPHLHYEVRDAASQQPLNPVRTGAVDFEDTLAPTIVRLHYVAVDTVGIVPVCRAPRAVEVTRGADGNYTLRDTAALALAPCGYFVLEATDRKNNSQNTMGIYRVAATMDGEALFGFRLDRFAFADTKYVNSLCHYAMQRGKRNQLLRLALQANNRLPVYSAMKNRGAVVLADDARHPVVIEVEDDAGNVSLLTFAVRRDGADHVPPEVGNAESVDATRAFTSRQGALEVAIPAGALYENIFFVTQVDPAPGLKRARYSDVHAVGDPAVPLHRPVDVSIAADSLPAELRPKACLALLTADGTGYTYAGGKYADGRVGGASSVFGSFCIAADQTPPTVTPNFTAGADLRERRTITITVRDDFSGIASLSATIDGGWAILEQRGTTYTHHFDPERVQYGNTRHTLRVTATDGCGNTTVVEREFVR